MSNIARKLLAELLGTALLLATVVGSGIMGVALANGNDAKFADPILQPGPTDGGVNPADQVGVLDRFVRLDFTAANFVDCATAWCWLPRPSGAWVRAPMTPA